MSENVLLPGLLGRLRGFVRGLVRTDHDADDVVQDVVVKFLEKGASVPAGVVTPWLFTVARREVLDRRRDPRSRPTGVLPDAAAPAAPLDPAEAVAYLSRCMEPMLASLRDEDRALLRRVDAAGEAQADVARELRLAASTLKSRVQRARRRLRDVLEDCCAVEHDRRGTPVDYRRRPDRACPCEPARSPGEAPPRVPGYMLRR